MPDCDHDNVTEERLFVERPEGTYPDGIGGICNDCGAALRLSGDEDEEGHPTWEIDYTAEDLAQIRRQSV